MPAPRGVKRTASKASTSASAAPKIKKKHGVQLEVPTASKVKGRLLACGQGDVGQLGLGEDVMETSKFKFVSSLGDKIVDVCAGGMHTVALDSEGKVWTFGCNDEGALGRQGEEFSVGAVSLPEPAVAVSAGDSHTAALLRNGDVYLWGSFRDSHGSMGLVCEGREGKSCREPIRLVLPEHAAAIASGCDHLIILTVTGAVYSAGCGEQGQLGRLSQRSASRHARQGLGALLVPTQVTLKAAIRSVWAGSHATFALDANSDKMLAWGLNNYNQLGVTGSKKKVPLFTPLEADAFSSVDTAESWSQVACGQHHSLALDNAGKCYAFGRSDYGRLGLGEGSGDSEALTPVPALESKRCVSIAAGTSSSFAVTDNGEVYAWGMGSEGQLGTGSDKDESSPRLIPADLPAHKPVKVSAGGQHTILFVMNMNDTEEEPEAVAATSGAPRQKVEAKLARGKGKAQKAAAEDAEVTSTNSAEAMEVDAPKKTEKKLNGEEEPTPMETDHADKPEENASDKKETQDKIETETQPEKPEVKPEESEKQATEPKTEDTTDSAKPEAAPAVINDQPSEPEAKTDTAPAEANSEVETKPEEAQEPKTEPPPEAEAKSEDVEMAERAVNGEGEPSNTEQKPELIVEKSKTVTSEAQPEGQSTVAEAL